MSEDNAKSLAAALGLAKLDAGQLAQLAKSIESGREAAAKLPKDLHWSEESALVFRLPMPADNTP